MLTESCGNISIIATSLASLDAEDLGGEQAAAVLGVLPPEIWPPKYNGPETRQWMRDMIRSHPDDPGFGSWYIVGERRLVGICGYKGPPNERGEVEIGYSVIEPSQRKGFANGAVQLLVERAFRDPRVTIVAAETLPSLIASQAVLTRNGFSILSRSHDPKFGEILRFGLARPV